MIEKVNAMKIEMEEIFDSNMTDDDRIKYRKKLNTFLSKSKKDAKNTICYY
ncbi:hypothetical protein SAMN02194393_02187 [Maledivibacter halophilus]|uniref:Uncharacterized protein n=1 Tax=Maledivibacter halophilus TaxID=36842 RepID=A0A1T5KZ89_9FIRM|nr:hypothetical protein SAMN02194393_02187 [Maledivibacter halophilus]